jgi:hypothetical protein
MTSDPGTRTALRKFGSAFQFLLGRLHEQAQEIDALNARLNDVILAWNRETVRAEAAEAKAHEQAQEIERLREQERQLGQAQAYDFPED